jgi:hypothetical protein
MAIGCLGVDRRGERFFRTSSHRDGDFVSGHGHRPGLVLVSGTRDLALGPAKGVSSSRRIERRIVCRRHASHVAVVLSKTAHSGPSVCLRARAPCPLRVSCPGADGAKRPKSKKVQRSCRLLRFRASLGLDRFTRPTFSSRVMDTEATTFILTVPTLTVPDLFSCRIEGG